MYIIKKIVRVYHTIFLIFFSLLLLTYLTLINFIFTINIFQKFDFLYDLHCVWQDIKNKEASNIKEEYKNFVIFFRGEKHKK